MAVRMGRGKTGYIVRKGEKFAVWVQYAMRCWLQEAGSGRGRCGEGRAGAEARRRGGMFWKGGDKGRGKFKSGDKAPIFGISGAGRVRIRSQNYTLAGPKFTLGISRNWCEIWKNQYHHSIRTGQENIFRKK